MKISVLFLIFLTIFCSCNDDNNNDSPIFPDILGMSFTQSEKSFDETYTTLRSSIDANPNIKIVAEVNHSMNASSVNRTLNPTRIIFFGNPNLGTPLMQRNQLAGLDLPQKILVYQDKDNNRYLSFNNTNYLSARHNLDNVATLPMIQGALTNLSAVASGEELMAPQNSSLTLEEGIVTKTSMKNFEDTYASLQMAIDTNPNLGIVAEVNHSANASSVGLTLNPTRLIIFGNPNLGTPLMQNAQTTALDLPQKMLVWQDDATVVHVSYNDPIYLSKRHGITENTEIITTITKALNALSNVAIQN